MKLNARISIGRRSDGVISIEIEDHTSGIQFIGMTLRPEDFANAITGLSARPTIECEVRGLNLLGKKFEHKEERIPILPPFPTGSSYNEVYLREQIKPFEIDGWKAETILNIFHKIFHANGEHYIKVGFVRYVAP